MHSIKTKNLVEALLLFSLIFGCWAYAETIYTYKCGNCGLIQQFSSPQSSFKCPKDGGTMFYKGYTTK
jgi:predicted RNA-binding Zn-ribbon protein involved in translation (DUF1610 family)